MSQTIHEKVQTAGEKKPVIRARLDDQTYEISIHEEDGSYRVQLGDESFKVQRQRMDGRGLTSLLIDNRPFEVEVERGPSGFSVTVCGVVHTIEILDPLAALARRAERQQAGAGIETIVAPMPGLVVSVEITVGDRVEAGTPLVVVEAMKMQNELSAVHPGVVRQVKVEPGQKVDTGEVLVVLEQA